MNQNELTQAYINWAVTAVWFVCVIVCFLKGKKWIAIAGIIASISDEIPIGGLVLHRIITTPLILYVYVAAIRLGRPDSFWSRRFYQKNPIKLLRAVERFGPQIEAEVQRAVEENKGQEE